MTKRSPAGDQRASRSSKEDEARRSRTPEPPEPDPELYAEASALAERASLPARHGNVLFATAGWSYPSVIKSKLFYPKGVTTPEARLRH